jgi:carbonic anhydrase
VNNTGFQIKVTLNAGTTAPTIQLNGVTYTLAQFHYHDPSENTVDGIAYPMEQHLVFTSSTGSELVVAAFVQVGSAANPSFQSILNAATSLGTTAPIAGSINLSQLLPSNTQGWNYQGSLTTPALTGPVNWLVLSTPITISGAQLQQYEADAGELGFLPNARPVQPLNGRELNEIDNYVNFQTGISPAVTGVNFMLSGSHSIPSLTPDSSSLAVDTSLMALASALNNVQASANALFGAVQGMGSGALGTGTLLNVGLDLLGIGRSLWTDIESLGKLLPAVDRLSASDSTLFFDAVNAEVPSELFATQASVSAIEKALISLWW